MMEKRRQSRSEVAVVADLIANGATYQGLATRNVSLGGVYLEPGAYPPPRPGANVEVRFKSSSGTTRGFQARVQRSGPDGVALLFRDFDLDDFAYLQQLLARPLA